MIKLPNRYGDNVELHELEDNIYQLKTEFSYRVGFNTDEDFKNGNYIFVDPSGGPFISIGYKIGDKRVSSIYKEGNSVRIKVEPISGTLISPDNTCELGYVLDKDNLYAGHITNTGCNRQWEIKYDDILTINENLQILFDYIYEHYE